MALPQGQGNAERHCHFCLCRSLSRLCSQLPHHSFRRSWWQYDVAHNSLIECPSLCGTNSASTSCICVMKAVRQQVCTQLPQMRVIRCTRYLISSAHNGISKGRRCFLIGAEWMFNKRVNFGCVKGASVSEPCGSREALQGHSVVQL